MPAKVNLAIDTDLLQAGERVGCAVSGGADSTALLLALCEANQGRDPIGVVLSAVHVHHGLRGADADADEVFVRELATRLGVTLTVVHVDTPARQAAQHEGMEEAARGLRYDVLWGLLRSQAADVAATGHTLDDQAETVMMKLLRGAWTEGLGGIWPDLREAANPKNLAPAARIVRPLLGLRRSEIEAFLHSRGQAWREDASNQDLRLTRNRVRHQLMPMLRDFNPGIDGLLAGMAEVARDDEAFWQAEVARALPQLLLPGKPVRGGGRAVGTGVGEAACALEIDRLRSFPPALRRRLVRSAAKQMIRKPAGAGEYAESEAWPSLTAAETAKVLALAGLGGSAAVKGKIGSRLELRGGLRVERSARELRFWRQP